MPSSLEYPLNVFSKKKKSIVSPHSFLSKHLGTPFFVFKKKSFAVFLKMLSEHIPLLNT